MQVTEMTWSSVNGCWNGADAIATGRPSSLAKRDVPDGAATRLVIAFGDREALDATDAIDQLVHSLPGVPIVGCSTAGEISGTAVSIGGIVACLVDFAQGWVEVAVGDLPDASGSFDATARVVGSLAQRGLRHVLLFADGLHVNGSQVAAGANASVPAGVTVSGGLAGDGEAFGRTLVIERSGARPNRLVAVGFYGDTIDVRCGSMGGWDTFGPDRIVTASEGNVLLSLDGEPALALYKRYLGPLAARLPSSGLLYPLTIRTQLRQSGLVRTILGIDEERQALIFAGDIPEGASARMMKANFDRLVDGAHGAARAGFTSAVQEHGGLAILISCVGRRLVLRQRVEEEVEAVASVLGARAHLLGFYSYGEIAPTAREVGCDLHNQTMTLSVITEAA